MTYQELDLIFPYIVFIYGATVSLVLNSATLVRLAEERLPQPYLTQLTAHRGIAMTCLWVGGIWALQNMWLA